MEFLIPIFQIVIVPKNTLLRSDLGLEDLNQQMVRQNKRIRRF